MRTLPRLVYLSEEADMLDALSVDPHATMSPPALDQRAYYVYRGAVVPIFFCPPPVVLPDSGLICTVQFGDPAWTGTGSMQPTGSWPEVKYIAALYLKGLLDAAIVQVPEGIVETVRWSAFNA